MYLYEKEYCMRGVKTSKSRIRKQIFTEIAKLAFEGWDADKFQRLPYKIIKGEIAHYRDSSRGKAKSSNGFSPKRL